MPGTPAAPPRPAAGWYLPDAAGGRTELDSLDLVEGLVIRGGLVVSWLRAAITAPFVTEALAEHWRAKV